MRRFAILTVPFIAALLGALPLAQGPSPQAPARDTPAQSGRQPAAAATGRITGRVVSVDNGRPVQRARVTLSSPEGRGPRSALTDAAGSFDLTALPPGRYNLSVSKSGYVGLSYGQRRPLLPGTPLQVADGQHLTGVEFRLPRGSVVSGHVYDELGDPMPGTVVQVMRYQLQQGERRLAPAGTSTTDDRGQYRVWGLNPGDYYVSARPRSDLMMAVQVVAQEVIGRGIGRGAGPAAIGRGGRAGVLAGGAGFFDVGVEPDDDPTAYAPTYYPGVASIADARPVSLGLGAEMLDVNFSVLLVRTATVSGRVLNPDGSSTQSGNVTLVIDAGNGASRVQPGAAFNARILGDGAFTIPNVPPGQYMLRARSDSGGPGRGRGGRGQDPAMPQFFGAQPVVVGGESVTGLTVPLSAGSTISGTIVLEGTAGVPQAFNQFRLVASPVEQANFGPNGNPRTSNDGTFTIDNVPAGWHWLRAQAPRGWTLKSLSAGAGDVADTPVQVRAGENLANLTAVFTNRLTEVSGTILNDRGAPVPDYTVLAFSTDATLWRPQSRHITVTRPDQNGKYQLRGLPPGDYYLAIIDPVEQGEWFDPAFLEAQRAAAARIRLDDGATRTHEFKVR